MIMKKIIYLILTLFITLNLASCEDKAKIAKVKEVISDQDAELDKVEFGEDKDDVAEDDKKKSKK